VSQYGHQLELLVILNPERESIHLALSCSGTYRPKARRIPAR
jgi:hypothetical protein